MSWNKESVDTETVKKISEKTSADRLTSTILSRRGIIEPHDVCYFLEDDIRFLHIPFILPGVEDAVDRILQAKEEGERVIIFGDKDIDGITGTVLLKEILTEVGVQDVEWSVPREEETYGISAEKTKEFAEREGTLLISVDCGITNYEEIDLANSLGIDTIILDHHNLQDGKVPNASIIVNPKISDTYPFPFLSGCGVAAKLVWALNFAQTPLYKEELCLVYLEEDDEGVTFNGVTLLNLVEQGKLTERVTSDSRSIETILNFIQNRHLILFREKEQVPLLKKIFGNAEIYAEDLGPEADTLFPALKGASLKEIANKSRIKRYRSHKQELIDSFADFFISYALLKYRDSFTPFLKSLDLVALSTVADMMPLVNENRILVKKGIELINRRERPSLEELLCQLKINDRDITATRLSWEVTPVLNATGRMGQADRAVALLLERKRDKLPERAEQVIKLNLERRKLSETLWRELKKEGAETLKQFNNTLILLRNDKILRGISGILASKVLETYRVPAVIVTARNGRISGSVRCFNDGFMVKLFNKFGTLFEDFGGHENAGGFSFSEEHWDGYLKGMVKMARSFEYQEREEPKIEVDAELPHSYVVPNLLKTVESFEPFGEGNRPLIFLVKEATILEAKPFGRNSSEHLQLLLQIGSLKWPATYWKGTERYNRDFTQNDKIDMLFEFKKRVFKGQLQTKLTIKDIKKCSAC